MAKITAPKTPKTPVVDAPKTPVVDAPTPVQLVIRVISQPTKPYRATSARGQYWAAVIANDGKPASVVAEALTATGAKTSAATTSWLAWFTKQNLITLSG